MTNKDEIAQVLTVVVNMSLLIESLKKIASDAINMQLEIDRLRTENKRLETKLNKAIADIEVHCDTCAHQNRCYYSGCDYKNLYIPCCVYTGCNDDESLYQWRGEAQISNE